MSKGNMEIRKSTREDIKQIMAIFTTAKEYMAAHGNKTQWGDGYPGEMKKYLHYVGCPI